MAVHFFDSSALVKRHIREPGSTWVQAVLDPTAGHHSYVVTVTAVEVVSAVSRAARGGSLSAGVKERLLAQFKSDYFREYRRIEVSEPVIRRAMALAENHALRAYDAIQLSAAL